MAESNWSRRELLLSSVVGATLGLGGCLESDGDPDQRNGTDDTTETATPEPTVEIDLSTERDEAPVYLVATAEVDGLENTSDPAFEWTIDGVAMNGARVGYGFERAGEYEIGLTVETESGRELTASEIFAVDPRSIDHPIVGDFDPEFAAFDARLAQYVEEYDFTAAAIAVVIDGAVVFDRGYGWMDEDRTAPIEAGARFRVGSVSKQFTAVAVESLIDDDRIERDDAFLGIVDLAPPGGELGDERWSDVTVGHLLEHRAGIDDMRGLDNPAFDDMRIVEELDLDAPPTAADFVRYTLARELEWDPDYRTAYSNLSYVMLGALIEQVTGRDYQAYLSSEVLEPAGIEGIALARSVPDERAPGTVWPDPRFWGEIEHCPNVLELDPDDEVLCTRGFNYPAVAPAAGHVAPARALAEFADEYGLPGQPEYGLRPNGQELPDGRYGAGGMHGGYAEVFRNEELAVAAVTNRLGGPDLDFETDLSLVDFVSQAVKRYLDTR